MSTDEDELSGSGSKQRQKQRSPGGKKKRGIIRTCDTRSALSAATLVIAIAIAVQALFRPGGLSIDADKLPIHPTPDGHWLPTWHTPLDGRKAYVQQCKAKKQGAAGAGGVKPPKPASRVPAAALAIATATATKRAQKPPPRKTDGGKKKTADTKHKTSDAKRTEEEEGDEELEDGANDGDAASHRREIARKSERILVGY